MHRNRLARIVGMGSYLPEKVLTNHDLEKIVDTSDEWIFTRSGIKERRIAREDEYSSTLGIEAAKRALADAGVSAEDVDMILVATCTPDYTMPSTAALIQSALGAKQAGAVDLEAACSGHLYGLSMAKAYVESGMYETVLVISAEKISSIVNYEDRNTCVLFGDGAGAAVVRGEGAGLLINHVYLGAEGVPAETLGLVGGGCRCPSSLETIEKGQHYISMEGREVFKHAVRRMEDSARKCLDVVGLGVEDVNWLVPHQANARIIDAIAKRMGLPEEKVYKECVRKYGNNSAASLAIALDELLREQDVNIGDRILLTVFGAGFTFGAALLTKHEEL